MFETETSKYSVSVWELSSNDNWKNTNVSYIRYVIKIGNLTIFKAFHSWFVQNDYLGKSYGSRQVYNQGDKYIGNFQVCSDNHVDNEPVSDTHQYLKQISNQCLHNKILEDAS